jgi:hypothetical protein
VLIRNPVHCMKDQLGEGLPFSDKKNFPRKTDQDGTDGSSVGIPPVSQKRKTSEFRSKPFHGREKPSEFRSEPFLGREKPSEFHSEPFLDEKNLGIPFRTIFGREKTSDFCSESFSEEKRICNSVPNHFQRRKNFGKRQLLLAAL